MVGNSILIPAQRPCRRTGTVVITGQIGVDYTTGHVPPRLDAQFALAVRNLERKLTETGATWASVEQVVVFTRCRGDIAMIESLFLRMAVQTKTGTQMQRRYQVVGFPDWEVVKLEIRATVTTAVDRAVL